jgi:hypothetical protein
MPRATRNREKSTGASRKAGRRGAPAAKRRTADPKSEILSLQHTAGNQAVSELLKKPARDLIGRGNSTGSGKLLDAKVKGLMESRFSQDFSDVRVHTDAEANESAKSLGATAYTTGNNLVFAAGKYDPQSAEGQQRIGHELAHVIQQRQSGSTLSGATELSSPRDASEREADAVGRTVAKGMHAPSITAAGVGIQRDGGKDGKIPLLEDFAKKFPDAAKLIEKNVAAMKLVKEASADGVLFGGFAEDGPGKTLGRAYTDDKSVYVPKTQTDHQMAMRDFLFELNNALRAKKVAELVKEAAKGTKGTVTAQKHAYNRTEQEVEGMLRLGEIWFETKKSNKDAALNKYDPPFFLAEYEAVKSGKMTKDDLVKNVLKRVYDTGVLKGKTVEQYYIEEYARVSGGK